MKDLSTTQNVAYTERLQSKEQACWKQVLDVQRPYRWHLQHLKLGRTLDLGCGIGRNLKNLKGNAVGIDHNEQSIFIARQRGFEAFTPADFERFMNSAKQVELFDSMLVAHVCEHMHRKDAILLIKMYLPYIKNNGRIVLITPQMAGYKSDETHVEYMDEQVLDEIGRGCDLKKRSYYSFPFPRLFGTFFVHNEHVWVGMKS